MNAKELVTEVMDNAPLFTVSPAYITWANEQLKSAKKGAKGRKK